MPEAEQTTKINTDPLVLVAAVMVGAYLMFITIFVLGWCG